MTPVSRARKVFDYVAGITLLLLGIAGLVLPVLQGVLLILAGLAILSSHSALARRVRDALTGKLKQARDRITRRG